MRACTLILLIVSFFGADRSFGQEQESIEPELGQNQREENSPDTYPVLNGHRFFPSMLVGSPFIQSTISSEIGGGSVRDLRFSFTNPFNDSTRTLRGDIGFLSVQMQYQHALDEYVAIFGQFDIVERIATHEESILSQGLTGEVGFVFGMRVRVWSSNQLYASVSGSYGSSTLVGVTPLDFLNDVLDGGLESVGNNSLVRKEETDRFIFGADIAYAPSKAIGVIGHLDVGKANAFEDGRPNIPVSSAGFTAHFDFGAISRTPIGFSLGLLTNSLTPGADDIATRNVSVIYGISYTGWSDFDFGLESSLTRLKQRDAKSTFTAKFVRIKMSFLY